MLNSLRRLEKVTLTIPAQFTELFRTAFEAEDVLIRSVHTLVLGAPLEWIVEMCPNAKTISTHDWRWLHLKSQGARGNQHSYDLIQAAGQAPRLQHFEMIDWWSPEMLEAVLEAMPGIPLLALTGSSYRTGITALLPILGKFTNLQTLTTASAGDLSVGFAPPECGNAYFGPNGNAIRRRVEAAESRANEKVARMVFTACPNLGTLWIGSHFRATVLRGHGGRVLETTIKPGHRNSPTDWPN